MPGTDPIAIRRLRAQRLIGRPFDDPVDVVRHQLAVQAQDYPFAKWGIGQRAASTTDAELDTLFDAGAFVRTHVMRPTWHFVAPEDIRWLLTLTAPRVRQASAFQYRLQELTPELISRANAVLERELAGGVALTREELGRRFAAAGIEAASLRLGYLLSEAEVSLLICNGPRQGRRQTYALLDERVPPSRPRERDEALAELGRRYVEGHGPAQAADLSWWSGLTMADARTALELATPPLLRETIDGRAFYVSPDEPAASAAPLESPVLRLLPNYDELLVAFRDRSDAVDPGLPPAKQVSEVLLAHIVVRDGLVVGGWRQRRSGDAQELTLDLLVPLDSAALDALDAEVRRYETFLGRPVTGVARD